MSRLRAHPDAVAASLLVLLSVALWLPRLAGPLDLRYDAGVYYVLGTSLAEGRGYRLISEPGAPQAIQYPPLLPAIVAAHQRLLGTSDPARVGSALRCTFAALFVAYVLLVHRFTRRWLTSGWALVATLLVTLHLNLLWLSDLVFADLPFALATVLFLLLAERRTHWSHGLVAGAAYLVRSTGVAALAAWVAEAVLRRRAVQVGNRAQAREAMIRVALAALPVLAWQLYVGGVQRGIEYREPAYAYQRAPYQQYNVGYADNMAYVDPFAPERGRIDRAGFAARVTTNLRALPHALGESVSGGAPWIYALAERLTGAPRSGIVDRPFALLGLICLVGQGVLLARGALIGPLYWAGSLALMVLTPWPDQFGRYLMPLAPLTALGFVTVLAAVAAAWPRPVLRRAIAAVVAGLLLFQIALVVLLFRSEHRPTAAGDQRLFFYTEAWRAQDDAIAWLAKAAPPDAVVATSTPFRVFLATGLRAVFPPLEADAAEADRLLASVPVEYLVVDDLRFIHIAITGRYVEPVVRAFPDRWTLVHGTPGAGSQVYRRAHPRGGPPRSAPPSRPPDSAPG